MTSRVIALASSLFVLACLVTLAAAQQDNATLKKDLTAAIALQGQPCGEVVSATVLEPNDYAATCRDGNKYRVSENDKGRVIVGKR